MSKTLNTLKDLMLSSGEQFVGVSNSNTTQFGVPVKEISAYFQFETDEVGAINVSSGDLFIPIIQEVLKTDEPIFSLSYDMYPVMVTDGDFIYNLRLTVVVSNDGDEHVNNILGDMESDQGYSLEKAIINGKVVIGKLPVTQAVYDVQHVQIKEDEPVVDEHKDSDNSTTSIYLADYGVSIESSDNLYIEYSVGSDYGAKFSGEIYLSWKDDNEPNLVILEWLQPGKHITLHEVLNGKKVDVFDGYIKDIASKNPDDKSTTLIVQEDKPVADSDIPEKDNEDKETSPQSQCTCPKGEPGVNADDILYLNSKGTIQLGNTSITSDDKTVRITADKITLEGVTIVQEPNKGGKSTVTDMSGTDGLDEFIKSLNKQ